MNRFKKYLRPVIYAGSISILIMLMIFLFSSQDADSSTHVSTGILGMIIHWVQPLADQLAGRQMTFSELEYILRKIAHFSEYALLGASLCVFFSLEKHRLCWPWAWLTGTVYACTDEIHQLFSDGRSASIIDVGIDSCGVLCGCLLYLLIRHIHSFMKAKSHKAKGISRS